jgi:ribosome-associated heat shock protein Hsp15
VSAKVRVDKWLWAARCFKHRSEATEACKSGHVEVNGAVAKPSRKVGAEDRVQAQTPGGLRILEIIGVAEKRGPASEAQALYTDHSPPPPEHRWERHERTGARPTKRNRRRIEAEFGRRGGFDDNGD